MKKRNCLFILMLSLAAALCPLNTAAATDINKEKIDTSRPYLQVRLVYNYDVYQKPFFFKPKAVPSYVVWIEAPDSGFQESIFVTLKAARNQWTFTSRRPEVIPVWNGRKKKEAIRERLDIDAISAATPQGESVDLYWQIPEALLGKPVQLFIEANNSFDFNEHYHKKWGEAGYSAANGQPSLVWRADLPLRAEGGTVSPRLIGHGHVMGRSHDIDPDLSRITTAARTFREITVRTVMPAGKTTK